MKQLLKKAKYIFVFVLAVSYLGCEDIENLFPDVVSAFTYTVNEDTGTVTFINISEDANTYLWNFGDGTTSIEINPVKSYADSGTYTVTLKALNEAGASDTTEDEITILLVTPSTCTEETAQSLGGADFNLTFQTDPGSAIVADGAAYTFIDNPDPNGINTSCKVGEIVRDAALPFANNQIEVDSKFDFNANAGFKLKVWAPAVGTNVLLKLEDKADSGINTEVAAVTTTANAWEELTFDFDASASGTYDKIVLFFDINTDSGATYYIDDFMLYAGSGTCTAETAQSLGGADFNLTFQTDPGSAIVADGAAYTFIDNPDPNGINTSCKVGEIVRDAALPFANNQIEVDLKFDFNANSGFKLKVWAPAVGTNVLVKLEDKTNAGVNTEVGAVTTTANAWEELTFDFDASASGTYDKIVLFFDINTDSGATYYIDDFMLYSVGGCTDTALELPIDFDCSTITYDFATFNGASYSVVDNPDLSGVNNVASKVGEIVNIGGAFEGGAFTLDTPVDFTTDKDITMKFYSTVAVPILLKFEGAGAPVETTANHGGTGWEQLTFSFTTSEQFGTLVLFVDGPGTTAGTFYMDDIEQVAGAGGGGTPATFPLDFEDGINIFNAFEGATVAVIDNPQTTGNTSSKVMELVKPSGVPFFAGINSEPSVNGPVIDLANGLAFNVKIWSPKAGINVRMRLEQEPGVTDPPAYEIFQTVANANEWVTVTFDFSTTAATSSDVYSRLVLNTDWDTDPAGGETYYIDDIEQVTPTPPASLELPISFDDSAVNYNFATFNGASYSVVDNPDLSGVNNVASKVGEIVNIGGAFEGGAFTLDTPVDFATDKDITMKFYSTVAVPILLKFEGAGAPVETTANHGGTGWEQLTFSFTTSEQFGTLVLFVDGPGTTAGTFYMDDIEQVTAPPSLELPISFDDSAVNYNFATFNGASYSVVDNPDLSGVNNVASKVGEIVNIGGAFEGGAFTLDTPVDFATDKDITMKFYSTVAVPILLKFEGAGAPVETTANHGGTGWEQLTFSFTTSEQFGTLVLFVDGPGTTAGTFYMDDIEQVTATPPASLELPISFDDSAVNYNFATFNGASYSVVDNPDLSGVNNVASKVGEIVNIGGAFEGGAFTLDTPVDFATDKDITMKFYSTVAVPILLKFEGAGAPVETTANHGGTGWEQLTFSFTTSEQFGTLVLFVDGPGTTAGTFYMDDIEQVAGTGGGGTPATFPLDFEDGVLFFNAFEGATVAVIDNPQTTGNTSSKVLEMVKPNGVRFFAGINSDQALNGPSIDLSNGFIFKVKVWSPKAGINVRMRLEQEPGVIDPPAYEIFQPLANANEWVTLTFDFTSQAMSSYVYTRLVLNTDWDTDPAGGETYYIDDITQE